MDLYEAIAKRYSVRAYLDKPVEADKLQRVLDAGRNSPSARNRQARKFVVVLDAQVRQGLAAASGMAFLAQAPVVVAVVGLTPNDKMSCDIPTDPIDCAIAIDHMTLAAVAEGLGTCWIGHFPQDPCRALLHVPDSARIVQLMPLGYPAAGQGARSRKPAEEIVCYDRFS